MRHKPDVFDLVAVTIVVFIFGVCGYIGINVLIICAEWFKLK